MGLSRTRQTRGTIPYAANAWDYPARDRRKRDRRERDRRISNRKRTSQEMPGEGVGGALRPAPSSPAEAKSPASSSIPDSPSSETSSSPSLNTSRPSAIGSSPYAAAVPRTNPCKEDNGGERMVTQLHTCRSLWTGRHARGGGRHGRRRAPRPDCPSHHRASALNPTPAGAVSTPEHAARHDGTTTNGDAGWHGHAPRPSGSLLDSREMALTGRRPTDTSTGTGSSSAVSSTQGCLRRYTYVGWVQGPEGRTEARMEFSFSLPLLARHTPALPYGITPTGITTTTSIELTPSLLGVARWTECCKLGSATQKRSGRACRLWGSGIVTH
jgi:hypothetical protein